MAGNGWILVSGGTGVMGSRLVRGLVDGGWRVRVLTLPNDPATARMSGVDCEIVYGDIADASSLQGIFDGVETVYHLAAIIIAKDPSLFQKINVQGTRNMVNGALAAGVKHFIYVSSASVVYPRTTAYSESKQKAEEIVSKQQGMQFTIIRPTLVYEEKGGQEFMMFMDYLKKYQVVPFIGRGHALKNPVFVEDILKGLIKIPGNERTYNKIYNFSGGEEIRIWDLAKLMLRHQKMRKPFIPIPVPICAGISKTLRVFMKNPPLTWNVIAGIIYDANLDNTSAREDLGYCPIGIHEGMMRCFPLNKRSDILD